MIDDSRFAAHLIPCLRQIMSGLFIYAGNISRGTASLVLNLGVPPLAMPLVICMQQPPPSTRG